MGAEEGAGCYSHIHPPSPSQEVWFQASVWPSNGCPLQQWIRDTERGGDAPLGEGKAKRGVS